MGTKKRKRDAMIFGGMGVAAVIVVALYIIPLQTQPAVTKSSPLRATADNFFKIRIGEDSPFFSEAKGGTTPYQYYWDFGDGAKSQEKSTTHVYTKEGTYKVTLTVTDSKGTVTKVAHTVDVYPQNANFTRGDDIRRS